jgi:hypothetical protein
MNKVTRLTLLTIFVLFMAAACSRAQQTEQVLGQIEIITLQTTPSLEHWLPEVAACAGGIPDFAVVTHIKPLGELDLEQADLVLRLGDRLDSDPFVAVLGLERTILLAGTDVPVNALSLESLQGIFTGEIRNWSEVPEVKEAGLAINQPIPTLSYPDGHELRLLFQQAYLDDAILGADTLVFSTEAYLQSLLEANPYAIAYTLESRKPPQTQTLIIREFEPARAQHKVLAITPEEPAGKLRQMLLCLQE